MTKAISLILSIFGVLVTAGLAFAGTVPPKWGLVIGAAVTVAYGVERTLQKILAGATLKSLLSTTEAWGAALTILAALATAITGVVPVHYATAIAAIAAIMLRFGRALQGGAAVVVPPTAGQLSDKPGPRPSSAGPMGRSGSGYDKGSSLVSVMIVLVGAALAILATTRICKAQTPSPQAIGCFDLANKWCVVPAGAAGWQVNLKTGSVANGVALAGLVLQHELGSIPVGVGLYGGLGASTNNQSSYQGCAGISVTNFGLLCIGAQHATFSDGSTAWQGMLTFAGQLTFGGTPAYMREAAAKAERGASK